MLDVRGQGKLRLLEPRRIDINLPAQVGHDGDIGRRFAAAYGGCSVDPGTGRTAYRYEHEHENAPACTRDMALAFR